jgi:hypothetical protein
MLAQIFTHTPVWVWLLLAFLIYRGIGALAERPFVARNVLLLPLVLTGWGMYSMANRYGNDIGVLLCWAAGFIVAGIIGYSSITAQAVTGTRKAPRQAGSVIPLVLIVAIFVVKYVVEVSFAMHPEVIGVSPVANAVALLFGGLAGLMAGRVTRLFARVRALPSLEHGESTGNNLNTSALAG